MKTFLIALGIVLLIGFVAGLIYAFIEYFRDYIHEDEIK